MRKIEEKLKEKSFHMGERLGYTVITIPDALEIVKDCYTKEEVEKLLKEQRENDLQKILDGLTQFTQKPLGTIEGDLCDWNKPSVFAFNYSPSELENKVVKRIKDIFAILNAPQPKLKGEE